MYVNIYMFKYESVCIHSYKFVHNRFVHFFYFMLAFILCLDVTNFLLKSIFVFASHVTLWM